MIPCGTFVFFAAIILFTKRGLPDHRAIPYHLASSVNIRLWWYD